MKKGFPFLSVVGLIVILALMLGDAAVMADDPTCCDDADCHEGIEDIRDPASGMCTQINAGGGCVVCHGGDATATGEEAAHSGTFYPDPGSVWIADNTCGQSSCH